MDTVIEAVIELLGSLLESVLENIKDRRKRKWALTAFYSAITLGIVGFLLWITWTLIKEGNQVGAIVSGVIAGLLLVVFGLFILRGHKQNWKNKKN